MIAKWCGASRLYRMHSLTKTTCACVHGMTKTIISYESQWITVDLCIDWFPTFYIHQVRDDLKRFLDSMMSKSGKLRALVKELGDKYSKDSAAGQPLHWFRKSYMHKYHAMKLERNGLLYGLLLTTIPILDPSQDTLPPSQLAKEHSCLAAGHKGNRSSIWCLQWCVGTRGSWQISV